MRAFFLAARRALAVLLVPIAFVGAGVASAFGQSVPRPGAPSESGLAEARRHFELGVAHFDRNEWQAALAEFLISRELAPTRSNTKNAAICLRKVGRFDEALDMFEALLREFGDLSPADRELALREIAELEASVGTLEIRDAPTGARVTIDGVDRGTAPLAGPVRLPAGTHTVRVAMDGALPFEARVVLGGRQAKLVNVRLVSLTQAARLQVREKKGLPVDVLIDGTRVGTAPWDGALAPGVHVVALRGEGTLGTPPIRVALEVGKELGLELSALPLRAELEVRMKPESADVFVDGVPVGRGVWRGRLESGSHRVEARLVGYAPFVRTLTLGDDEHELVSSVLEPSRPGARVLVELDAGVPVGLLWGGDLMSACTPPCSSSLPLGVYALGHAAYRFSSGIGLGVHAGYLRLSTKLSERSEFMAPQNRAQHPGTVNDYLRVAGLMAGAEADYAVGADWPIIARIAAGALIGAATDERSGTFVDSEGASYSVSAAQYPRASYFYLGPELRFGYRVGTHFEASLGLKLLVLAALARPTWDGDELYYAGDTDRAGVFESASLTGPVMVVALPGVAARYAF
ncbi:MAG TPA: PEGA domain-containing protein [Polyangiaceae bacterium]